VQGAVAVLEKNPDAADLKPCGGQVGGDCIAPRPVLFESVSIQEPSLAHVPLIERKIALLIGVNEYEGSIPKLSSPLKDVEQVGRLYRDQFGYEVRVVPNGDKASIVRELNRLITETRPNDSVVVFYAGHGQVIEKTGRGYWIPARASADEPSQWISNRDIARFLENIPAKQVLLVSDSCYSGTLTREARVMRDEVLPDPAAVLQRRSVTVLSSGGEEPVADAGKDGHSVFAWHFMQSIRDVQRWSSGVDVYERLKDNVAKDFPQEPQYGAAIGSGHQTGADFLFEVRRY
jgi:hypothetical protein